MTLTALFTAICQMLQEQTGTPAFLGLPDEQIPGIYVWPWRLTDNRLIGYRTTRPEMDNPARERAPGYAEIDFLVLVRPALSPGSLTTLESARRALLLQPLLSVEGESVQMILNPLDVEALTRVFIAAGLPLTICLSVTARAVPEPHAPLQP